jgi:hypothetical protein
MFPWELRVCLCPLPQSLADPKDKATQIYILQHFSSMRKETDRAHTHTHTHTITLKPQSCQICIHNAALSQIAILQGTVPVSGSQLLAVIYIVVCWLGLVSW